MKQMVKCVACNTEHWVLDPCPVCDKTEKVPDPKSWSREKSVRFLGKIGQVQDHGSKVVWTPYLPEIPLERKKKCKHRFLGGYGIMGDAVTCIHCGLSAYPEVLTINEARYLRKFGDKNYPSSWIEETERIRRDFGKKLNLEIRRPY